MSDIMYEHERLYDSKVLNSTLENLIRQYHLEQEKLTEKQLVDCIKQILLSGDIHRYVTIDERQCICYTPYRESVRYQELLYAVERKFEGETRHETALRYIREAEARAKEPARSSPCSPSPASDSPHT